MNYLITKYLAYCLPILFTCYMSFASAQNEINGFNIDADQFYKEAMERFPTIPGAIITVVDQGEVVYSKGLGYANLAQRGSMTENTNFYIASSTKSFTALLASLYDHKGLISLEAPLTEYFPNVNFAPAVKADQVKVRDLLTHTSGIQNSGIGFRVAYSGDHDHETLMRLMDKCEPNSVGLGKYQYTNVGYNIYGLILQEHLGKSWQQCLKEEIFTPLGMRQTSPYMSEVYENNWPLALPYLGYSASDIEPVYLLKKDNTMQSAGGLVTTGNDLATWLQVQLAQGKMNKKQIFPLSVMRETQKLLVKDDSRSDPFKGEGYGMGWHIGQYKGEKVVSHFGGFPGYATHVSFLPEKGIGVAVMINEGIIGTRLMSVFATYAYDYLLGDPNTQQTYKVTLDELSKRFEQLSKKITKNKEKRAKREWQLSQSFSNYNGLYTNDIYGTVKIEGNDKQLKVSMGNMHCNATPYVDEESIRIEMVPGYGEVLQFKIEAGKVRGFYYDEDYFSKG